MDADFMGMNLALAVTNERSSADDSCRPASRLIEIGIVAQTRYIASLL
jgi:hypothetical protein